MWKKPFQNLFVILIRFGILAHFRRGAPETGLSVPSPRKAPVRAFLWAFHFNPLCGGNSKPGHKIATSPLCGGSSGPQNCRWQFCGQLLKQVVAYNHAAAICLSQIA
jgi:hypothetical protein